MEPELFNTSIKNIANRYNEEISKLVLSGTPISPQILDAVWGKHCRQHVDAMYSIISTSVHEMVNNISIQVRNNVLHDISRSAVTSVECTSRPIGDNTIKVIIGLKVGSRYIPHRMGFVISVQDKAVVQDRYHNVIHELGER